MNVLLLDADGVILEKGEYFSERFSREYNVPIESVLEFFKGPFVLCQRGEADLKIELLPYLEKWNWNEGVEAFLVYWFNSDFNLNHKEVKIIQKLREKGIKCYLASNNEAYRANFIRQKLTKDQILDGEYFSADLKLRKEDPAFFEYVLQALGVSASEVSFIDNDQKNILSASSLGINALLYHEGILESFLL